jgi:hypothetical protein
MRHTRSVDVGFQQRWALLLSGALLVAGWLVQPNLCAAQTVISSQIGFAPSDPKFGVLAVPSGTNIEPVFQVITATGSTIGGDTNGNRPVGGAMTSWMGSDATGETYRLDFSEVTTPGTYRLRSNGVTSYPFVIRDSIYDVRTAEGLTFFEIEDSTSTVTGAFDQGVPILRWTALDGATGAHRASHQDDARQGQRRDPAGGDRKLLEQPLPTGLPTHPAVSGGWYDAGDYNKYMGNTPWAVYLLLLAYEEHPDYWSTSQAGDRNGNGRPDILDHAQIALEWMNTMVWTDGSVFERVFNGYNAPFDGHPDWETNGIPGDADDRPLDSDRYADITAKSSYAFAAAARIFGTLDSSSHVQAARYLELAQRTWQWAYQNQGTVKAQTYGGGLYFGDVEMGLTLGALELLRAGVSSVAAVNLRTYAEGRITAHVSDWNDPSSWDYQPSLILERYFDWPQATDSLKSGILTTLQTAYAERLARQTSNAYHVNDEWLLRSGRRRQGFGQNDLAVSSAYDALWLSARGTLSQDQRAAYRTYALNEIQWVWGRNPMAESWLASDLASEYTRDMTWKATARHPIHGVVVPGATDYNANGIPDYEDRGDYYYAEPSINQQAMYVRTLALMDRMTRSSTPSDFPPTVTITQPIAGQLIQQPTVFTISAQASDDLTGVAVSWAVDDADQGAMSCSGGLSQTCTASWSTIGAAVGPHTITVTAMDSAHQARTATVAIQVTSSTAGPSTIFHIADLRVELHEKGSPKTGQVQGKVRLQITDQNGTLVPGVVVTGHWEGSVSDAFSGVVDSPDSWLDYSNAIAKKGTVTFTAIIDSVSKDGWVFDAAHSVMSTTVTKTY